MEPGFILVSENPDDDGDSLWLMMMMTTYHLSPLNS